MAKECFCGCGRKVPRFPLGMRSINTRGRQVVERLERNRDVLDAAGILGRESDEIAHWFGEGDAIVRSLSAATHGELDPNLLDEPHVRQWQARGREIERRALPFVGAYDRLLDEAAADLDLDFLDEELPDMDWNVRPRDASATWPADVLATHMMGLELAIRLADGTTLEGRLDDVAKDRTAVEIEAGEILRVASSEIDAYTFLDEEIDHSNELGRW